PVAPGADAAGRRRCRDAWAAWWKEHGAAADLATLARPSPRTTLVVQFHPESLWGQVLEVDARGRTLWEIDGLDYPLSAEWLPGGGVLVAESRAGRVSERDQHGVVVWSRRLDRPVVYARRLPGGGKFLAFRDRLVELDRDGKEVLLHRRPARD